MDKRWNIEQIYFQNNFNIIVLGNQLVYRQKKYINSSPNTIK